MYVFIKIFIISCLASTIFAQNAQEFKQEQMQSFNQNKDEFAQYKKTQESEFETYKKAQNEAFNSYKKELSVFWEEPKTSTNNSWVSYTQDKKTRTDVDFKNEIITLETIASSEQEAKKKLQIALLKVVTINTKEVQETDPLEIKLEQIKKPFGLVDAKVNAQPILSTVIFDTPPTEKTLTSYVNENVTNENMSNSYSKITQHEQVYLISVNLPKDTMKKRSTVYYDEVKKNADEQKLPMALVFAIMHSESHFNPRAKSHVPAFGLMQIVPRTAGIDSFQYLYKEKKLVSGKYLYNSKNNIKMGSAYLHILYYKYLRKIKDHDSRLYCAIAAYNTGPGNIAWAFTGSTSMSKAAPYINSKTPKEVYDILLKNLRYEEPKKYLKKVTKRMSAYYKLYGS